MMMKPHREVRIVCTGNGNHKPRELITFMRHDDDNPMTILPGDRLDAVGSRLNRAGRISEQRSIHVRMGREEDVFEFSCPSCRLHVQWADSRALQEVDQILAREPGRARITVAVDTLAV